jgi:hypothetical protein
VKLGNSFCYTAAVLLLPSLAFAFTPTYILTDPGLLPGTTEAESLRINDKGDSIGVAIANQDKGVLFHNDKVIDVAPTATSSFASGLNSTSQVAGYMFNGTAWVGFTYNLGQVCGQSFTASKPIKDETGKVIGETPAITAGFVDLDGTLRDVNKLMNQSGKGWVISRAQSINDLDQVLADANFNGGTTHAVKLTPNAVLPNLVP